MTLLDRFEKSSDSNSENWSIRKHKADLPYELSLYFVSKLERKNKNLSFFNPHLNPKECFTQELHYNTGPEEARSYPAPDGVKSEEEPTEAEEKTSVEFDIDPDSASVVEEFPSIAGSNNEAGDVKSSDSLRNKL